MSDERSYQKIKKTQKHPSEKTSTSGINYM